jgi:hypothetical protein
MYRLLINNSIVKGDKIFLKDICNILSSHNASFHISTHANGKYNVLYIIKDIYPKIKEV